MKRTIAILTGLAALALLLGLLVGAWSAPAAAQVPLDAQSTSVCHRIYLPLVLGGFPGPPPTPGPITVTLTRVTPSPVRSGEQVIFEAVITNTGASPITVLPLKGFFDPDHLEFESATTPPSTVIGGLLQWGDLTQPPPPIGPGRDLEPGESLTVAIAFRAVGCPPGQATVKAEISGAQDSTGALLPEVSSAAGVHIACSQVTVTKTLVQLDRVGGQVTFEISVENTGNTTITLLPLEDAFDPDFLSYDSATPEPDSVDAVSGVLTWNDLTGSGPHGFGQDLNPGESFAVALTFNVMACPGDQLTVNTATVSGAIAEYACSTFDVPDASGSAGVDIPCPDIHVTKALVEPVGGVVELGQTATFQITIENPGNKPLVMVPLDDIFDRDHLEFVSASVAPDAPPVADEVEWEDLTRALGDIAPGGAISLTVTFRAVGCPPAPDPVTFNKAKVRNAIAMHGDEEFDVHDAIDTAGVTIACPEVEVTKTLEPLECALAGVGDVVTFTIHIENVGNTTITELPLEETYEADCMAFTSATPEPDSVDAGTLLWHDLTGPAPHGFGVDLAPGSSFTVIVTFTITASTQAQLPPLCDNEVLVSGATDEYGVVAPEDSSQEGVETADADLFITKTQMAPTPAYPLPSAYPGSLVTYTLTYGNNGPDPATFVVISDALPAGTVFVDDTLCGHVNTGCYLGTLQAGFSDSFELTILVPYEVLPGTVLTDEAWIESGHTPSGPRCGIPDANPDNNRATFDTVVVADFGDAPDPPYPTRLESNGAYHADITKEWLGEPVSPERSAVDPTDPDGWPNLDPYDTDGYDDGVIPHPPYICGRRGQLSFRVTTSGLGAARYGPEPDRLLYLRVWWDTDREGWDDDPPLFDWWGAPGMVCSDGSVWPAGVPDHVVTKEFHVPRVPDGSSIWIRARLSYGEPTDPYGPARFGEVEDHEIVVQCH